MRIKISLRPQKNRTLLTWHYQYPMQAAIYKILTQAEPEYAEFLHNLGYALDEKRRTKMFTFSRLDLPKTETSRSGLLLSPFHKLSFFLSSPMEDSFVQNIVIGMFEDSHISLGDNYTPAADFDVESVESLPEPELGECVNGTMLSPLICSIPRMDGTVEYIKALNERLAGQIESNILKKHVALHGMLPDSAGISYAIDREYILKCGGEESRKITSYHEVKRGTPEQVGLRAFSAPFTLQGHPALIKTAYCCGIGEKNSLGFGMWGK